MFKVNNKDNRTALVVLVSLLVTWTYFTPCSSISIVNFEHALAGSYLEPSNIYNVK